MKWLRRWLGLDTITDLQLNMYQKLGHIKMTQECASVEFAKIRQKQDAILSGVGRILAQIGDTAYAKSPHDPKVQAESKEIGEAAIARLEAEAKVRSHYGYDK